MFLKNVIEKFVKNNVLAYRNLFVLLVSFRFVSNWRCYEGQRVTFATFSLRPSTTRELFYIERDVK